jgi:hypothetical protein
MVENDISVATTTYSRKTLGFNFIVRFPWVEGMNIMMVVVDRTTKYTSFIDASRMCMTKVDVGLF